MSGHVLPGLKQEAAHEAAPDIVNGLGKTFGEQCSTHIRDLLPDLTLRFADSESAEDWEGKLR